MIIKSKIAGVLLVSALVVFSCSKNDAQEQTSNTNPETAMTSEDSTMPGANDTSMADTTGMKVYPVRDVKNPFVTIETDYGKMVLELYRDVAPAHADSFIALSKKGFYDGTIFHRVIKNFMIQGGDPKGDGTGRANYTLKAEFSSLPHQDGTLSMARAPDPNSASCQFFVCLGRNSMTSRLDNQYTVFGQLIRGYEALHQIGDVECKPNPGNPREISRPVTEVYLRKAYVSDAMGNPIQSGGSK